MGGLVASPASGGWSQFWHGLAVQKRVVGALLLRELHTRYGRDNIGYLWMFGEPMILGSVISLIHGVQSGNHYSSDIGPVPFTIMGYTIFIMFRGIFNRSEGALEANAPLMYHKMVTIFDIMLSRAIIEAIGCFSTTLILLTLSILLGLASFPVRPIYILVAVFFMAWFSFAASLIVVAMTYHNHLLGRLVHPFSYFQIPISGAFWMMTWLPPRAREWLVWYPMTSIFEMARYGQFRSASPDYFFPGYLAAWCAGMTWVGMTAVRRTRRHISLL